MTDHPYSIDLTSDSPPRTVLTLPGSSSNSSSSEQRQRFYDNVDHGAAASSSSASSRRAGRGTMLENFLNRSRHAPPFPPPTATPDSQLGADAASSRPSTSRPLAPTTTTISPAATGPSSSPTAGDDDFEVTGMSEGALRQAERARLEAEEAQLLRRAFFGADSSRTASASTSTPASASSAHRRGRPRHGPPASSGPRQINNDGLTIHEQLAPGPHRSRNGGAPPSSAGILPPIRALASLAANNLMPHSNPFFHFASLMGPMAAGEDSTGGVFLGMEQFFDPPAARTGGAGGRGGGATRSRPPKIVPSKHDPKMVLNHKNTEEHRRGFEYGIVEPPVDVETFDEDPRIITGPLPETTPICAGCGFALVLGGDGKRRIWALPCGHVIDGRCHERLCQGISKEHLARHGRNDLNEERDRLEEEAARALKGEEEPSDEQTGPKDEASAREAFLAKLTESTSGQVKRKRVVRLSDGSNVKSEDGTLEDELDEEGDDGDPTSSPSRPAKKGKAREVSPSTSITTYPPSPRTGEFAHSEMPPLPNLRTKSSKAAATAAAAAAAAANGKASGPSLTVTSISRGTPSGPRKEPKPKPPPKTFRCPVRGCVQLVATTQGKAASAVGLYI